MGVFTMKMKVLFIVASLLIAAAYGAPTTESGNGFTCAMCKKLLPYVSGHECTQECSALWSWLQPSCDSICQSLLKHLPSQYPCAAAGYCPWAGHANVTKDDPLAAFPSWVKSSLDDGTCAKPGHCGRAYQACCAGFAAKGYPCTCHLVDGTGKTGNCGTCGTAYSACCAAYGSMSFLVFVDAPHQTMYFSWMSSER